MRVWLFSSFDLGVVNNLFTNHWVRADNSWFVTGLLSLLYGCLKCLGGLAMMGLAFLSIWHKCCQQIVSRTSVLLYAYPLYNRPLHGATLASFLSTKPLKFLEVSWWTWWWTWWWTRRIVAPCPRPLALQEGRGKKSIFGKLIKTDYLTS